MANKCPAADHAKLKSFNYDRHCAKCGTVVNEDALTLVNCKKEHKIHASRGLKYCPDCGKSLAQS